MTIKSSVDDFYKAIEKERLIERSVYLLDQVFKTTTHRLAKIRIAYNTYERKKITRHGTRENHYLYHEYITTSKTCIELKETLLKKYELFKQIKEDILRTDEFGKLHAERYVEFIFISEILSSILENIKETFGGWFISYSLRMSRICNRFNYHRNALVQLFLNEGKEVPSFFREGLSVKNATENENVNLKEAIKSNMKTRRYSKESSPGAIPVTVASRKLDRLYAPMALYYKNSPLQGVIVPIPKNKEYLENILSNFLEVTSHFDSLSKRLNTLKEFYSETTNAFKRRNKTFTGNPGSIRLRTIDAVLLRMSEFKKLVQEKQIEVKELDINKKKFDDVLDMIEKGPSKNGYLELKRIIEHLFHETRVGNVGYESFMEIKAIFLEIGEALDRSLKKNLEKDYVDTHFPKISFDIPNISVSPHQNTQKNKSHPNKSHPNKSHPNKSRSRSRSRSRPEYEFHD